MFLSLFLNALLLLLFLGLVFRPILGLVLALFFEAFDAIDAEVMFALGVLVLFVQVAECARMLLFLVFSSLTVVVVYVVVVVVYVYVALGLVVFLLRQRFVVLVFNFLSLGFADRVADATSTATTILYYFRRVAETIISRPD